MRKKLVYICSPCRGDMEKNIIKAKDYCREAVELWPDVIPIAPHVYFTQFLDDTIEAERAVGMDMGIALLDMCDELWVYGLQNPSEGMKNEIAYAVAHEIPIRDAANLYRERGKEDEASIGDLLILFEDENMTDLATVRMPCNQLETVAKWLRRHRGTDLTMCGWEENQKPKEPAEDTGEVEA